MSASIECNHPISLRLSRQAGFNVRSPKSLIGAGFASLVVGLLTTFRFAPLLLHTILIYFSAMDDFLRKSHTTLTIIMFMWLGAILCVLFVFGIILLFAVKIRSKELLMAHPWGLLLLYFDFLLWMGFTILLDIQTSHHVHEKGVFNVKAFIIIVYFENFLFLIIYYFYATYYIAAELTVIERFYSDET